MLDHLRTISLSVFQNSELLFLVFAAAAILLVLYFLKNNTGSDNPSAEPAAVPEAGNLPFLRRSLPPVRFDREDRFFLYAVCAVYALISFHRLGSHTMPVTTWQPVTEGQQVIFELPQNTWFDRMIVFYGEGDNNSRSSGFQLGLNDILVEGSNDQKEWVSLATLNEGSIYRYLSWYGSWNYRYIRLTSFNDSDTITEIAFIDSYQGKRLPVRVCEDSANDSDYPAELMIDEQLLVPLDPTYYDESYFDEVYHPRNAWEIVHHQFMYYTVHPLLGTEIIALSIRLFGMNPFAWRLPGVLFGIGMLPLLFHILCLLFRERTYARFGTVLFAAEFMHLTTSRIATLEPMSIFFILLMTDRMIQYCRMSFYDRPLRETLLVLLRCGIDMGLAIAVKWTACYSAVGLAVMFFTVLYLRYREYTAAEALHAETIRQLTAEETKIYHHALRFPEYALKTILWAVIFFFFIPLVIYYAAYLPAPFSREGTSIQTVVDQTLYIYRYHSNLTATHPYQSNWIQWLTDDRPIWYYGRSDLSGVYHTIACFTNPLISLAGLISVPVTLYEAVKQKSLSAGLILIGFFSALLPWTLIDRCVFAYHFYPSSVFMILAIVCAFRMQNQHRRRPSLLMKVFELASVAVFIVYLPILTGFGTRLDYVHLLEVFPSWYFG
ncbi:MAG: phospholipid carrier-dependent glycosyltransferase [Solobacterium sp.]|nr:phospholipid carrier-dependent glycosyltransferase [Solobacterium sp.]